MRFFYFGLLRDRQVLELVIDRPIEAHPFPPARLADARLVRLRGQTYPMLVPAPGRRVDGVIVDGLSEADVARILFFESVEYEPEQIEVIGADGAPIAAHAFATTDRARHDDEDWRFEDWLARDKVEDLRIAALWMSLCGRLDVVEADRRWEEALASGRPLDDLVRELCAPPRRLAR
jgi:hypothetical protein